MWGDFGRQTHKEKAGYRGDFGRQTHEDIRPVTWVVSVDRHTKI